MVGDFALFSPYAGSLAVEDHVVHREVRNRLDDGRVRRVLRQSVAREQADAPAVLEREQTDAVELALEDPLRPGEPLLR